MPLRASVFTILMAWLIWGTLHISPAPLEFFNELAGGQWNGYRFLVDSNVDWGQNLWDLRRWMKESQVDQVRYAHYSPADPNQYGVDAMFLPPDPRSAAFTPWNPEPGIYVLGATVLQGVYTPDINTYAYFRDHKPLARVGGALFIYKVDRHTPPAWVVSCDPEPATDRIQQALSNPEVRILHPDCHSTQIYPAGSGPGYFVVPPGLASPQTSKYDFILKNSDGSVWRTVSIVDRPPDPQILASDTEQIEGPLSFLGFSLENTTLEPGSELLLETYWQVMSIPDRPLSILAQLTTAGSPALAIGDGMGFPIEEWSVDDIIIQTHKLIIPEILPENQPVTVLTGAYWLDTLERWNTGGNDNTIVLHEIDIVQ